MFHILFGLYGFFDLRFCSIQPFFSTPALGAGGLKESLLLQLDAQPEQSPLQRTLVADHLKDLEANRLPKIARTTGRTIEEIQEAIESLRRLDASPASEYGEGRAAVILPDVLVEEVEGEFIVRLERERQPKLRISRAYREMLRRASVLRFYSEPNHS